MFCCLPDNSKCEWRKLESFVGQYNKRFNTKYFLSECLDVFDSTKPQPEIRLKAEQKKDIVIEHKIITWPPNYLQMHRAQHEFMGFFTEMVKPNFQDDVYLLSVDAKNIEINKTINESLAKAIAEIVINNREKIRTTGSFYYSQPFKWLFRCLSEFEKDDNSPQKGVGVQFNLDAEESEEDRPEIIREITNIFISHLKKTETKFHDFSDCIRIFITELYGEHFLLDHQVIEVISSKIKIPNIDQIWVGYPGWVSESSQETIYKLIKTTPL